MDSQIIGAIISATATIIAATIGGLVAIKVKDMELKAKEEKTGELFTKAEKKAAHWAWGLIGAGIGAGIVLVIMVVSGDFTIEQIQEAVDQPTTIQTSSNTQFLSISRLKQVLDETSAERVEITIGKIRDFCNQGIVICYDHPNDDWSVMGPSIIATDPLQQPINGAQIIKVNNDASGNWLPNWPIGLFYIPTGQNVHVPTPGVAYPLEESLPTEWIIR